MNGTIGKVVNGRVELEEPQFFPEGTVLHLGGWNVLETAEEAAWPDEGDPVPVPVETYEEHLASLRQSIADAKAGLGIPFHKAMAQIRAEIEALPHDERDA